MGRLFLWRWMVWVVLRAVVWVMSCWLISISILMVMVRLERVMIFGTVVLVGRRSGTRLTRSWRFSAEMVLRFLILPGSGIFM